jgi:hypothetical protein
MVSIRNMGTPVALAFGPVENAEFYNEICTAFAERHGIDPPDVPVLSDEGSRPTALRIQHRMAQYVSCMRYRSVGLKHGSFKHQTVSLVGRKAV